MLFKNSGTVLDGEIKTISLYLFTSLKSLWLIGPIIIFTPFDFKSCIAEFSFFVSLKPESLGIIKTLLSFISLRANSRECKSESPSSLYSPDSGASKPIFNIFLSSFPKRLELKKIII